VTALALAALAVLLSGPVPAAMARVPAIRHAHRSATGQREQAGAATLHTTAPSSMVATAHRAASASSSGSNATARSRSALVRLTGGSSSPTTARAITRRTLVSRTA
jgi:hypothetical protein